MVSFPEAIKLFYKNYTNFEGRSCRSEYWWTILWQFILATIVLFPSFPWLIENIDAFDVGYGYTDAPSYAIISLIVAGLVFLGHIIPIIAIEVRRWHDLGQTGWLFLLFSILGAIPIIGWVADIANIIWFCFPGTKGPNKYGSDPLSSDGSIFD